jgi:hypothetical protein
MSDDQPFVDHWPTWDEPLSKIPTPFDIERAHLKLARRFNRLPLPAKRQGDHAPRLRQRQSATESSVIRRLRLVET